ncbi:MAG: NAD(P)H-hydrate dehydratase [Proteobacteria bacterium]|nr:NAD(P)H-hydrate dehydratase [Pseudomonadota bacterium]
MNGNNVWGLLTVEEMGRADALAVEHGVPSLDLMEAAGASVAAEIRRRWPVQPVVVLCGPGNNGGDGFVIARYLKTAGWPVRLALLGETSNLKGDAAANAKRWDGGVEPLSTMVLDGAGLVVDAIFGAGLTRALDGAALEVVNANNAGNMTCVGVDIPSGIDGNSGAVLGAAPCCALTVTFFRKKPGHLLLPGRVYAGETVVSDIGIPAEVLGDINPNTVENHPQNWIAEFPVPTLEGHKYRRGHAVICGGAEMTGAARLAARAARRAGAGMLTIIAPKAAVPIYAVDDPGNIIVSLDQPHDLAAMLLDKRRNAVLVGPGSGLNEETRNKAIEALRSKLPTVLDADALTVFADDPGQLFSWIKGPCVLTPHEGEFDRLFPGGGDKLSRARTAAKRSGAVILFKGADTVIAHPDGRAAINANAPPELATAGAGDVLAGIILGLLAQGMPAFEAAEAGAWLHGAAAQEFGPGLIAEDIPDRLPKVLRLLR